MNKKIFLTIITILTANIVQSAQNNNMYNGLLKPSVMTTTLETPMAISNSNQDSYSKVNRNDMTEELDAMREERKNERKEKAKQQAAEREERQSTKKNPRILNPQQNITSQQSKDSRLQRIQQQIDELESLNDGE